MAIDYLATATKAATDFRAEHLKGGSVRVILRPIGEATFARSRAEILTDSVLTVTANDNDYVLREYKPDQWYSATVYDASGFIVQTFISQVPA